MKRWSLAISAQKGATTRVTAAVVRASSKQEAIGKGIEICRREFPSKDGWYSHAAVAMEIPE